MAIFSKVGKMFPRLYLLALLVLLVFPLLSFQILGVSSNSGQFNVTPNTLLVNWTNTVGSLTFNGTILQGATPNPVNLTISNATASIVNSTGGLAPFVVFNDKGLSTNLSNLTPALMINTSSLLFDITSLRAGRYNGTVLVRNLSNATDSANISVILDVPVKFNTLTIGGASGVFSGNLTNSTTEIFYFNTTNLSNVVKVNLSFPSISGSFRATVFNGTQNMLNGFIESTTQLPLILGNETIFPFTGFWFLNVTNNTIQNNITFSGTVELIQASLRVNNSFDEVPADDQENISIKENLGYSKNLSFIIPIFNGASNYAINLTVNNSNNNLTMSSSFMNFTFNISSGFIPASTTNQTKIDIVIDTSKTSNTEGVYRGWIYFTNTSHGQPFNSYNLSLLVNLTRELALTDLLNSTPIIINKSVNISLATKYQNLTTLTNFNTSNYIVYIQHNNFNDLLSEFRNVSLGLNVA